MRRILRWTSALLVVAASSGCSGSGGGNGPAAPTDDGYAVTATITSADFEAPEDFASNNYFANNVGNFAFAFQAVDGVYTILLSIQSVEGERLPLQTHTVGSDEETRIVTGASIIVEVDGEDVLYNTESGDGAIELTTLNAFAAAGSFVFEIPVGESSTWIIGGEFDLEFRDDVTSKR